jgi:diadenylate cyclase
VLTPFRTLIERPQLLWDVFDILLVSLLIYEALKLIKGTRAMQMAIGSVFVLLLFYVSQRFPLQTVNWLIRNLLVYVVFGAIVLFQSDIRRALSHLGRAPFFRYFARSEQVAETIEEIITAASQLAKARIGAIIVIEREIGLRNYVESGIPVDALVSYDLLTTVFQPKSPLHDGAVIIQEERIAAAACFLPLTVNPKLDRDLGTRHRAAIGLTEECDAVAIVVSEERGEVSLSLRGRIERAMTPEALRARLQEVILHRRPKGGAGAESAGEGR